MRTNFLISFVFILIVLTESIPLSNLKTNKTKVKMHSRRKASSKVTKEYSKEYFNKLVEKGLKLDNLTAGHPPYPFYEKINYEEDLKKRKEILKNFQKPKNRRRLYETQRLENLGFFDLYQNDVYGDVLYALKFLMNSVKKDDTKFILYPYPFSYTDQNDESKQVENGGFFSLNESLLNGGKFNYLQNISSVEIGKAKGIYDIDIGIMSIIFEYKGRETDLFTEASLFCEFFVNNINKITSCLEGKEKYLEYKKHYPNKGAVVRISNEDLLANTLFDPDTEQLKIKLLIFPDYLTGNEETLLEFYIKEEERQIIRKFRELGGHIITSGKSGYILELIDLIPMDTYDNSITIQTKDKDSTNQIHGCENLYKNSPLEQEDYLKELICMGYKNRTYLTQAFPIKNFPSNFESLIQYENKEQTLIYKKNGYTYNIDDKDAKYDYILISKDEEKKGKIMIVNGSPIKDMYYFDNVRNMILYAMTKNVIYDLKIKFSPGNSENEIDLPIPAGEEGVQLVASYKLYNLADYDMTDVEVNILIRKKIEIISNVEGCTIVEDDKYKDLNLSFIEDKKYLKCSLSQLNKLSSYSNSFTVEITDYTVTQQLYDIPLMYSNITYLDNYSQKEVITPGLYYVQASLAALLRGTINKDPTSIYPLEGYGRYFDLVLNVENKEATEAIDVNYISLIPLVTPLFDGEDEGSVSKIVPLYELYYENHNYNYPWKTIDGRGVDFIDYAEIAGKGVCYVADYDTPVKLSKVQRDKVEADIENIFKPQGKIDLDENAGQDKAGYANSLLKQIYFADNEKFYETAAARTSLFINTGTEEGAKALFGETIPTELQDPYNVKRTKVQYAFIRVDTYFYNSIHEQYQLPNGFNDSILISIDKFNQSSLGEPTGKVLGEIKPKIVNQGHYNSTKERYNRLKPNEYSNSLREYEFMKQYDPTDPQQLEELKSLTNGTIRLSHFMVPFTDKNNINKAGSILGFEETNEDGSGHLKQYPSVKFVYGHSIDLVLNPAVTRLGGSAQIILGEANFGNEDPIINERITISADNVAFYKTEYYKDNNTIIVYFKRGLMPNENYGQPSKCKVFIENLNKKENFNVTLKIFNLKYDFGSENLESLVLVEEETKTITAAYIPFFSLPCLYMENKLKRKTTFSDEVSHNMYEYELMNPYARYGGYYQELTKHTAVYASAEAHHVKRPGYQSASSGFSLLSNIGTSSVPFAEFLEHGKLAVPGVVSTSRLEWTDIWGRKWGQNLRSVYPDIPVLPPVPLSFIMTTTFELITNDKENKQERVLEWQSDESVYIRVQMKVRNTYKLYWEPTICKGNQISFQKTKLSDYKNPLFVGFENIENLDGLDDTYDINLGFTPQYGICYDTNSYMGGLAVNSTILETIKKMTSCSNTADAEIMTNCSKEFDEQYKDRYPIVKKRPDNAKDEDDADPKKRWNYSPLIEKYLPDGYIHSKEMWQLTMEDDYWDDSFYKGYPWHLDDCIPNLDNPINKPHDLIAFPIFKGLGYSISYSKEYSLNKFKEYKGWWSDQLQNKDHTLIAGQQKVNQISVGKESLLKDSDWINGWKLKRNPEDNLIKDRLKNIYVCQYNQHRVKVKPGQDKYAFLKNVYQNNVVPVLPDLKENDYRYNNFECTENTYQYSPYNISQVDNRVYTGNDRDWLYFAVGLRSNARENINVILKMDPMESSKFEGITKVQDGGRFTYWQPPDGPNSYQYYDCNVNTVISKRVDLSITQRMIPTSLKTFNTFAYQLFTISDKNEKDREYTMHTYMNSHGYGDAATTIYVGGTDSTSCKVNPKEFTYVKIVFYNNAGFDWKMKENAITMNYEGYSLYLNAMSIMMDKVTAIQYPKEYNFMSYEIPAEIKDFVTLTPSQHVLDISPQFYDLTFNNILNIKDGLEGDYFYCLNISESFPDKYKGKLWEIKMKLNEEYFESLPGKNDPTGIHDYHLTIPSIRFGVPIASGPNKGKVFYNLGQAKNLVFTYRIYYEFNHLGIKIVNDEIMNKLSEAISIDEKKYENLQNVWDSVNISPEISSKIKITEKNDPNDDFYKLITIDLSEAYPLFPYEVELSPYETNIYLLVQSLADHVPFGYRNLLGNTSIVYNDGRKNKQNLVDYPLYINCYASGPHLEPLIEDNVGTIDIGFEEDDFLDFEGDDSMDFDFDFNDDFYDDFDDVFDDDFELFEGDTAFVKLTLSTVNEGTETAYNVLFNLGVDPEASYIEQKDNTDLISYYDEGIIEDEKKVSIFYDGKIYPGDEVKFDVYFEMQFGEKTEPESYSNVAFDNSYNDEYYRRRHLQDKKEKSITFVRSLNISLCLADVKCQEGDENYGIQKTNLKHKILYNSEQRAVGRIILKSENIGTDLMPKYVLTAIIENVDSRYNISEVVYLFKRKIEGKDKRFIQIALTENNTIIDIPFEEGEISEKKEYKVQYKVIGEFPDGRTLDSLDKNQVTFTYLLEDDEEENSNGGLPIYAIIIIIVVGMAVIVAAGFLIYKFACKKKNYIAEESLSSSSNNSNRKKFQEISVKEKSSTRTIKNIKVIRFDDAK